MFTLLALAGGLFTSLAATLAYRQPHCLLLCRKLSLGFPCEEFLVSYLGGVDLWPCEEFLVSCHGGVDLWPCEEFLVLSIMSWLR